MIILFVMSVLISVRSAYFLRAKCSGPHLGFGLFCVCLVYNLFFITYYMRVLEYSKFLFIGYYPEFVKSSAAVNIAAMVGVFFHCGALPRDTSK